MTDSELLFAALDVVGDALNPRGRRYLCADCGADTVPAEGPCEYYAVLDDVWEQAGMGVLGGFLCVSCLQARLGRPLNRTDFKHALINASFTGHSQSRDLLEALERNPGEPVAARERDDDTEFVEGFLARGERIPAGDYWCPGGVAMSADYCALAAASGRAPDAGPFFPGEDGAASGFLMSEPPGWAHVRGEYGMYVILSGWVAPQEEAKAGTAA